MKTVRILSGGYGLKQNGYTTLVLKNETCSVEDDEALRLESIGAAVILGKAEEPAKAPEAPAPQDPKDKEAESEDAAEEIEDEEISLETMTNAQLIAMCKEMGINTKTLTNKTKLINAIKAAQDEMPELGAEDFE